MTPSERAHAIADVAAAPRVRSDCGRTGERGAHRGTCAIVIAAMLLPVSPRAHAGEPPQPSAPQLEPAPAAEPEVSSEPPPLEPGDAAIVDDAAAVPEAEADTGATQTPSGGRFRESPPPPPRVQPGGPAPAIEPTGGVVGGYWDLSRTAGKEPPDGDDEIIAGSILLPLGTLSVASAASMVWLSLPGHCAERWQSIGASPTHDQCKGLYALSLVRVVYGGLMIITGGALLGVGLVRRKRHRAWERGGTLSLLLDGAGPGARGRAAVLPRAAGLMWTVRLGARGRGRGLLRWR
ncbi:MAG: hypothetical protein K1X88_17805 [Nannocystaceae bacterium]|nr:hypothetical protein [Nannocystaceae bacterium]